VDVCVGTIIVGVGVGGILVKVGWNLANVGVEEGRT
jgi:hypothetical protein